MRSKSTTNIRTAPRGINTAFILELLNPLKRIELQVTLAESMVERGKNTRDQINSDALSTHIKTIFFLCLPWHHVKNIYVHMDPFKTTQHAVVHIPGPYVAPFLLQIFTENGD